MSARLKLTLSYAGFVMLAGVVLLTAGYFSLSRGGHPGVLFLVRSHSDLLRGFAPTAALVMGFLLVFGLAGGWILAGRMLEPLDRITAATRLAATGTLSHRIAMTDRDDEFGELAAAFDAMLARLQAHVDEQQRFAANASHELRTPLAITKTLLDVARSDPDRPPDELVERLHHVNARAIDLTEALLVLARAGRRGFAVEPVDLSLLAEEAAETLLPLAEGGGVDVDTTADPAATTGSTALLLQLTTNLLHNAIVHNVPGGGHVWVRTRAAGDAAELVVENTGPPLSGALVATLAEPFRRGTDRVRGAHEGAGLGLAIARSIAEAHAGSLDLAARAGGGLRATVRLPVSTRS